MLHPRHLFDAFRHFDPSHVIPPDILHISRSLIRLVHYTSHPFPIQNPIGGCFLLKQYMGAYAATRAGTAYSWAANNKRCGSQLTGQMIEKHRFALSTFSLAPCQHRQTPQWRQRENLALRVCRFNGTPPGTKITLLLNGPFLFQSLVFELTGGGLGRRPISPSPKSDTARLRLIYESRSHPS